MNLAILMNGPLGFGTRALARFRLGLCARAGSGVNAARLRELRVGLGLILAVQLSALPAFGQGRTVMVATNGVLLAPDNFFATNRTLWLSLIPAASGSYHYVIPGYGLTNTVTGTTNRVGVDPTVMATRSYAASVTNGYGTAARSNATAFQAAATNLLQWAAISTNQVGVGTLTATNLTASGGKLWLASNTNAPAGLTNSGALWNSNGALYWVTLTRTNLVSDGR